jgi:protein-disulfide isomerase
MSKRVAQKQASRVVREQLAKEQRRKRTLWISVAAAAVLVLAGLIGYGIYAAQKPKSYATPKHATEDASGIATGTGPATIDVYLDFMCPHCKVFETEAGPTLKKLVAENKATVVNHPLAFLDRASTTNYSTRSAASSGCAADGDKFVEYADALFARQPAEGSAGLSDDELIQIGGSVGLIDPAFARCVRDGTYTSWVGHVTDAASERGVNATPTVFVNGNKTNATAADISAAVGAPAK